MQSKQVTVLLTWRLMPNVFVHLVPGSVLLLPDDDFSVIWTRSQDVSEHGMSPGYLPNGAFMAADTETEMRTNRVNQLPLPVLRLRWICWWITFINITTSEVIRPISSWFSIVPSEVGDENLASIPDIKDLHGAIGGTRSKPSPVVIHLSIVLPNAQDKHYIRVTQVCDVCVQPGYTFIPFASHANVLRVYKHNMF